MQFRIPVILSLHAAFRRAHDARKAACRVRLGGRGFPGQMTQDASAKADPTNTFYGSAAKDLASIARKQQDPSLRMTIFKN
jgi:hypothetical protein